jgi:hypothetical protein
MVGIARAVKEGTGTPSEEENVSAAFNIPHITKRMSSTQGTPGITFVLG